MSYGLDPRTVASGPSVSGPPSLRGPERERLPRAARIHRGTEIRAMFRKGTRKRTRLLDLYCRSADGSLPRIGYVVPKLGHRIVARNRIKRRVREIGRRNVLRRLRDSGLGMDILIRIRRPAYRATYAELELEILKVVEAACSDT